VPPQPLSLKKLVLFIVVGLLFIGGITLAAWEEGRVGLFSGFGLKGYKRREADGLMVASKGKKPDFKEAFRLYQIDAEKGDGEALRKIGEMYRDGKGVPQSYDKARKSWELAAAPGDVGTLLWLADKHRDGDGRALPINHPEGILLLRRAASQGDAGAQKKLALQLLSYADEYQMKLAFDEVLSARQQMELLSLPKVAELIDASDDAIKKMTKGQLAEKLAAVRADLSNTLREKFNWEAYFWLSLSAASNDDVDLRARREDVGAKIKEIRTIERIQGLVSKWSQSDAPGSAESPFTLDEAPILDAPVANKQTLFARLEKLEAMAATLPEAQPEPSKPSAPKKPAGSASAPASPAPQKPASVSSVIAAMPVQSVDPEKTKKYIDSMYEAQFEMAVRRNVLVNGKHNATYGILARSYAAAIFEIKLCEGKLKSLRADSKLVHPYVLAYADRMGQLAAGRVAYLTGLQQAAATADQDASQIPAFQIKFKDFEAWSSRELVGLDATEAMMTKRVGDELSVAIPDRNQRYAEAVRAHERAVDGELRTKTGSDLYAMLVGGKWYYGGWTFEFGELRESRVGRSVVTDGEVSIPLSLAVVGSKTSQSRTFDLTLYFTVTAKGSLRLIGVK
jgi:hypothetical protein